MGMKARWPVLICMLLVLATSVWRLSSAGWDPAGLAQLGTRFTQGDPNGTEGYDGQFAYYIALDPDPHVVDVYLDAPAYRYQRILLPILAWVLALGQPGAVGWTLWLVNLIGFGLGVWALAAWLSDQGESSMHALAFGLWVGYFGGVALDLSEPLAYGLAAAGWLAVTRRHYLLSALLFAAGILAKETVGVIWAAAWVGAFLDRRAGGTRRQVWLALPGVIWIAWQGVLWSIFGHPGVGSGGAYATPFEWIPFMGLARVAGVDVRVFGLYLVIFGPAVLVPTVWGLWAAIGRLRAGQDWPVSLALLLSAAVIVFLPFSTFREPFGLVRLADGLVLAVILFASRFHVKRVLNYSYFWAAYLLMLVRS
jgi:hypothetical protein